MICLTRDNENTYYVILRVSKDIAVYCNFLKGVLREAEIKFLWFKMVLFSIMVYKNLVSDIL